MKWTLRKAEAKDAARINELFVEMLQTISRKDDVEGYKDGDLDYYFSGGEDWICVAESEGEIVAFLSIEVHHDEGGYLYYDDFSVSREYRGRGIGTALAAEAERYAERIGISAITLHVEKDNASARRLYGRMGFELYRDDGTRLLLIKHLPK